MRVEQTWLRQCPLRCCEVAQRHTAHSCTSISDSGSGQINVEPERRGPTDYCPLHPPPSQCWSHSCKHMFSKLVIYFSRRIGTPHAASHNFESGDGGRGPAAATWRSTFIYPAPVPLARVFWLCKTSARRLPLAPYAALRLCVFCSVHGVTSHRLRCRAVTCQGRLPRTRAHGNVRHTARPPLGWVGG